MTPPSPAEKKRFSLEEYLAWERDQLEKHDWYDGEVFAMAGGTPRHNALSAAVIIELGVALRGGRCRVLSSDQKVVARPRKHFVYPDVTVVCGQVRLEPGSTDVITNPSVIVEVLSESTQSYDRGLKWEGYQRIESLDDYFLVAQHAARIEHFQRNEEGWSYRAVGPGERITLKSGAAIELDPIYDGVLELEGESEPVIRPDQRRSP